MYDYCIKLGGKTKGKTRMKTENLPKNSLFQVLPGFFTCHEESAKEQSFYQPCIYI